MDHRTFETRCSGVEKGAPVEPCTMVIFGASGDLARSELLPSLYELARQDLLPERFAVLGVARREWSDDEYRDRMRESVKDQCSFDEGTWKQLARGLFFVQGDLSSPPEEDYRALGERLSGIRSELDLPDNVFFHFAVPPSFFPTVVERLRASGLARSERGWRRLVIEKPFGRDERSARELDATLQDVFEEDQIYRIDHFLGKETVQNMLVFRFANPAFEPIWNHKYVDHVQITAAESGGIGTRGGFYEQTGVVRDMVQNHLLQLLCMVAIEPPVRFNGRMFRDETAKVLEGVRPLRPEDCVRGQYGAGCVDGADVHGYRDEERVAGDSVTPTFSALKLHVDNWRWAGVPFYLRTGKRMERKHTEVAIHFKATPHLMFPLSGGPLHANTLVFRLQPDEGIVQTFAAKQPGPDLCVRNVRASFLYAEAFDVREPPRAYAWLLHDVMQGDPTLFARSDWIRQAWQIVDPLIRHWESRPPEDFPNYGAGSWGPAAAADLIHRDGREWLV